MRLLAIKKRPERRFDDVCNSIQCRLIDSSKCKLVGRHLYSSGDHPAHIVYHSYRLRSINSLLFVMTIIRFILRFSLKCREMLLMHLSSGILIRCKSMIIRGDCFSAARKLFSMVRELEPFGDFISHCNPPILTSGVLRPLRGAGSINTTDSCRYFITKPAVASSCFSIFEIKLPSMMIEIDFSTFLTINTILTRRSIA